MTEVGVNRANEMRPKLLEYAILRAAAWPIEMVEAFAASALAAAAVALFEAERNVLGWREAMVAMLHAAVPQAHDRRVRAYLLAVKRQIYSETSPLPACPPEAEEMLAEHPQLATC